MSTHTEMEQHTERMEGTKNEMHGIRGKDDWTPPRLVAKCDEANRPGHGNYIPASEYVDEPEVLEQKVEEIAKLLKQAKCCTAYTGAGLSRAAGIGDYASKAKNSITNNVPKLAHSTSAKPTFSHRALVELERAGLLHQYVQQNHDGLPQKAGFPQEKLNEIHGAWFDPSNPVVKFSGSLRTDLFDWLETIIEQTDLCLCLGTSLSGMNADRTAEEPAAKSLKKKALGTVIINLQRTKLDKYCAIRVWAKLDDVFEMLLNKLQLTVIPRDPQVPKTTRFIIPYNKEGLYDPSCKMVWNLDNNQKIKVTNPHAMNFNETGIIERRNRDDHFLCHIGHRRILLGHWWGECLQQGKWPYHIPFINYPPEFL